MDDLKEAIEDVKKGISLYALAINDAAYSRFKHDNIFLITI